MTEPVCQPLEPRRLFTAGDPLDAFGDHGVAVVPGDIMGREMSDVKAAPGGKVLASINELYGEPGDIVRYNADGSLDSTFGTGGLLDTFFSTTRQISVRSDGRFYAVGTDETGLGDSFSDGMKGSADWFLARFLPSGKPDRSFGRHGRVALQLDPSIIENYERSSNDNRSIALDADGRLTLLAYYKPRATSAPYGNTAVFRYDATGRFDPAFNGGAPVRLRTDVDYVTWPALAVAPNGEVLVAGIRAFRHRYSTVAKRFTASGTLDTRHTPDGYYTVANSALDQPRAAFAPDGHIFISATEDYIADITHNVYKLRANGRRETAFAGGRAVTSKAPYELSENPLLPLADGGVIMGVNGYPPGLVMQRWRADGTLDAGFGVVGTDSKNPVVIGNAIYSLRYNSVVAQTLESGGTSPFSLSNKRLTFNGTDAADAIEIGADTNRLLGDAGDFKINRGFWTRLFPEASVTSLVLNAGAGDDDITVAIRTGLPISVTLNAGAGDDTITATGARITVHGGAGDDTVKGDSGDSDPS